jgi:hypothetical protein
VGGQMVCYTTDPLPLLLFHGKYAESFGQEDIIDMSFHIVLRKPLSPSQNMKIDAQFERVRKHICVLNIFLHHTNP